MSLWDNVTSVAIPAANEYADKTTASIKVVEG